MPEQPPTSSEPPLNLLFITADQWRGDCLSARGHPIVATPHLDALAAEGVLFAQHYCQAVPCGPSRASLHTGLYLMNHRSGTNGTPLDRRHVNWAQVVRGAGRDPVLFGYTDTSVDPRDYEPDDPALTTYEGLLPGLTPEVLLNESDLTAWADWLRGRGVDVPADRADLYRYLYRTKANDGDLREWEDGGAAPRPLALGADQHDTRFMTDATMAYIDGQSDPWTVHLSLYRPHPPWVAPAPYNNRYPPANLPEEGPGSIKATSPDREGEQHPWLAWQLNRPGYGAPVEESRLRRLQASYYGLMSEVDDNLGRLFQHLKDTGAWQRTLIIFTSDHGEQLGDHWLLGKTGYFDQSFHVPMIVRDPRATSAQGRVVDAFTEHVDVMPTLLEGLGCEAPLACDGASLYPFLTSSGPENWRAEVHWEYDFRDVTNRSAENALGLVSDACNLCVIRDAHYKYVHFSGLPALLFDLDNDPEELRNLAGSVEHAATVLDYAQRMLSWRMAHADRTLTHLSLGTESAG